MTGKALILKKKRTDPYKESCPEGVWFKSQKRGGMRAAGLNGFP